MPDKCNIFKISMEALSSGFQWCLVFQWFSILNKIVAILFQKRWKSEQNAAILFYFWPQVVKSLIRFASDLQI